MNKGIQRTQRYLLSCLSGCLLTLAFPYTGSISPLVFIALVPLFFVQGSLISKGAKGIAVFPHAYLTFLIFNIGTTWWIWNADVNGAIMAFIFNSLLMALFYTLFHSIYKRTENHFSLWSLIPIWLSFEYLHLNWELSHPWLNFGNFFSIRTQWIQWYEYTGALGGTVWIIAVNILSYQLLEQLVQKNPIKKLIITVVCVLITPIIISFLLLIDTRTTVLNKKLNVVVVQPNIDPYKEKFIENSSEAQTLKFIHLAAQKINPLTDLVLGPETALSEGFNEKENITPYYQILGKKLFKGNERLRLLIGASTYQIFNAKNSRASIPFEGGYYENYNASLYLSLKKAPQFIHKSKLVLGVEKIPFSNIFPFLETLAIQNGGTAGTLGVEPEASIFHDKDLEYKGFGLAPVVCYESIYGAYLAAQTKKGSNLICILTNDGWWGNTPGYQQHFSFARLRAIENRRWVVRSANTGSSGVIDEYGNTIKRTNYWEEAVFSTSVPLKNSTTFYVKWGDYLGIIGINLSLLLLMFPIYLRFKKAS